jgi:tRNA(His) guanylyltransferase
MRDPLGDRMKHYEKQSAGRPFSPKFPAYARIDGRGFSRFTSDMTRPFDARMTAAMIAMAEYLLINTHAKAAYVQSDELSLAWMPSDNGEHFFGGKPMKMASVLAGMATAAFIKALLSDTNGLASYVDRLPHFDARVVEMPNRSETAEMFAWRGQDARRNGINQIAHSHFATRDLFGVSTQGVRDMLAQKGITPCQFPAENLNGTLLLRQSFERVLTEQERARIPEHARPDPGRKFIRKDTVRINTVHPGRISNLEDVIFNEVDPILPDQQTAA